MDPKAFLAVDGVDCWPNRFVQSIKTGMNYRNIQSEKNIYNFDTKYDSVESHKDWCHMNFSLKPHICLQISLQLPLKHQRIMLWLICIVGATHSVESCCGSNSP